MFRSLEPTNGTPLVELLEVHLGHFDRRLGSHVSSRHPVGAAVVHPMVEALGLWQLLEFRLVPRDELVVVLWDERLGYLCFGEVELASID